MIRHIYILIFAWIAVTVSSLAQSRPPMEFPRWAPSVRGGALHDFETGMDGGGAFSVDRYYTELGLGRMWRFDRMVSVSYGFGRDDYHFNDLPASGGPWGDIENQRIGLFARWALDDRWTLFAGPSVRAYYETGADPDDGLTAAVFGGASYRFNDRLSLGPGFGVVGQLEDDPSYFPVLVVKWAITDKLDFQTGGGLAATGGPGLALNYRLAKKWKTSVSVRYERKRFRLADDGPFPGGVGEDKNIPVFGSLSYEVYPRGTISAIYGAGFGGNMMVEKSQSINSFNMSYDNLFSFGFAADFKF